MTITDARGTVRHDLGRQGHVREGPPDHLTHRIHRCSCTSMGLKSRTVHRTIQLGSRPLEKGIDTSTLGTGWSPRGQSHTWTLNELWGVGPSSGTSLPVTKGRAIRALLPRRRIGRPYRAARRRRGAAPQRPNRRLASKRVRDDDRLLNASRRFVFSSSNSRRNVASGVFSSL
jgi:hypothetical protein